MKHYAILKSKFNKLEIPSDIREFIKTNMTEIDIPVLEEEYNNEPKLIGKLNKPWGIIGFNRAEIGHPVYEVSDRYIIYLSNEKISKHEVRFYKETLLPNIDKD